MSFLSPVEQMQELEQRLQEAEQRAENAETQVTGEGIEKSVQGKDPWPFLPPPMHSRGHAYHADELLTRTDEENQQSCLRPSDQTKVHGAFSGHG